ncbi:MFS transporter [Actinoplanes sp. GCM10030250]|uniref:MFS transporter n=1 Tax=Actinoplanes sp. GCM10030250 TaxID=3273376 RepID=UPI00361682A9
MSVTAVATASEGRVLARYLAAATGARLADEGARVSIVLLALERTGDAALGGLLVAALMVPHVVVGPLAGAAADAARRRKPLYVIAFLTYAVAMAGSAALIGRNTLAATATLILAGCLAPLLLGGLSSLLSELVPNTLSRALAMDATTYGIAGITGPALAALVAGVAGPAWSMVALGGFVVVGAALFLTLPVPAAERRERRPWRVALFGGLTAMVRRRRLGAVTVASGLSQIGFGALPLAAALVAADKDQPALTGLILSITAAGGVAGSLLCTRLEIVHRRPEAVLVVCSAAMTVPFLLTSLLPGMWVLAVLFALAGLFASPVTVALFAVRNREAPPEARTQVFTLGAGIKVTAAAAGAAASGLAAPHGAAVLLIAIGACQLLSATVGALLLRGARDIRQQVG